MKDVQGIRENPAGTGLRDKGQPEREPATVAVTVIVPTTASRKRGASLLRAIDSIRSQQGVNAVPLIVANGPNCDRDVLGAAQAHPGVHLVHVPEPGLPGALRAGRALVDTPFFAFLDDDDELLPGALARRLAALEADSSAALAVTAGEFVSVEGIRERTVDLAAVSDDPVEALARGNWLASAAGLYRTAAIGPEVFANVPAYLEWTYVALRIALHHRIAFVEDRTFVCHLGSPDSLSASKSYLRGQPGALQRIMDLSPPPGVQAAFRHKYVAALHHVSTRELSDGNYRSAWHYHLATLSRPEGFKYFSYTRHLIFQALRMLARTQRASGPESG